MVLVTNTWTEFLDYLLMEPKIRDSDKNITALKSKYLKLCKWFEGKDFTRTNFTLFLSYLKKEGYKPSYLNGFIRIAKHYDRYIDTNCIQDYTYFDEVQDEIEVLSIDETEKLINAKYPYQRMKKERQYRDYVLKRYLYDTASRIQEVEELKWSMVRYTPIPHIFLPKEIMKSKRDRLIPITHTLFNLLNKLPKYEYVFGIGEQKLDRGTFTRHLKETAQKIGISKNVYPHLFRHTKATHLTTIYHFPIQEIAKFLDHKDPMTTMRYTHPLLVELAGMAYASPFESKENSIMAIAHISKGYTEQMLDKTRYGVEIQEGKQEIHIIIHP